MATKKKPAKPSKTEKAEKPIKKQAAAARPPVPSEEMTEAEEQQALEAAPAEEADEFEEGSSSSGASGPSMDEEGMLALTARAGADSSVSFKNFRHHPDMENFYRFVYENDLRYEALAIIDQILAEKHARKEIKVAKGKAH